MESQHQRDLRVVEDHEIYEVVVGPHGLRVEAVPHDVELQHRHKEVDLESLETQDCRR